MSASPSTPRCSPAATHRRCASPSANPHPSLSPNPTPNPNPNPTPNPNSYPNQVRLAFGFPEKVVGATRLRDGIERIMSEYDYTSKSEAFNKNHRWMQLLDSVELGLQVR